MRGQLLSGSCLIYHCPDLLPPLRTNPSASSNTLSFGLTTPQFTDAPGRNGH